MSARKLILIAAVLLCGLALSGVALAMSSTHYRLDWFTPATGGGGGPADSSSYAVNLTVGQSAISTSTSTHYAACLGYWCGLAVEHHFYLPLMSKRHH